MIGDASLVVGVTPTQVAPDNVGRTGGLLRSAVCLPFRASWNSQTCLCEWIVPCAYKTPSHVDKVQSGVLETLTGSSRIPVFTPVEVSGTQVSPLSGLGSLGGGDDRLGAQ